MQALLERHSKVQAFASRAQQQCHGGVFGRVSATHSRRGAQVVLPPPAAQDSSVTDSTASDSMTEKPNPARSSMDGETWGQRGVPSYLQSSAELDWNDDEPLRTDANTGELLWQAIRKEAQSDAASEPMLSSFLYASVLAHDSLERALSFVLANRLANATLLSTQLFETFYSVVKSDENVRTGIIADIIACRERDPSCRSYSQALLYYKGYHAIQAQRIAHALWLRNQKVMALALQSRISEVLAVDIHPAAQIGKGILLDHGTGVVIGETAVIGNNVSLLQNVTLGGTGKETGDRHPKIAANVLIGASATILGNIAIGQGSQIAAGSLVLKPVPPHTLVAGSPAKEVGKVVGNPARTMVHWSKRLLQELEGRGATSSTSTSTSTSSSSLPQQQSGPAAPAEASAPSSPAQQPASSSPEAPSTSSPPPPASSSSEPPAASQQPQQQRGSSPAPPTAPKRKPTSGAAEDWYFI